MFVDGNPVFVDPGTYIYHCDLESRNAFRKTENHNTVCINGKDQSEMLGAFLWGRKAECELIEYSEDTDKVLVRASHNGYQPVIHTRSFIFNKLDELIIQDEFETGGIKDTHYLIDPKANIEILDNEVCVRIDSHKIKMIFSGDELSAQKKQREYSSSYGNKVETTGVVVQTTGNMITTKICLLC